MLFAPVVGILGDSGRFVGGDAVDDPAQRRTRAEQATPGPKWCAPPPWILMGAREAHWCTILVSVTLDGLPMHPRRRWVIALLARQP
ncbi:hypothetical protein ABDZ15_16485 [Mycobacterium canetti]|nr:hypothetical protein [Mycobacterium canetti]